MTRLSRLYLLLFFSIISADTRQDQILKINQEIENIFFQTINFEFDQDFKRINGLMEQCDGLDYLEGESTLLSQKCQIAVYLGKEELIYDWNQAYKEKADQAIRIGIADRELYYKFLSVIIETQINGFEYQRETLTRLLEEARRKNNLSTEAHILFYFYFNLQRKEQDDYRKKLELLYKENSNLKMSWTYFAFQNMSGLRILYDESDENKAIDKLSFPQEIETLLYKSGQLYEEQKYKESIHLLLEANDKYPDSAGILNMLVGNYLYLHISEADTAFLNKAEVYALKALSIEPEDKGIHYNQACIYSKKNNIDKSLYHLEKSLELGIINYSWMMEDPDLNNLREFVDLEIIIAKYDKWTIAYNHFSEFEKNANKQKLYKVASLAEYRKHFAQSLSFINNKAEFDLDYLLKKLINKIKPISVDYYLEEIKGVWSNIADVEGYEKAIEHLTAYIQLYENLFDERKLYLKNKFNSSLDYYNTDQTFEEYKARTLSSPYDDLANMNLKQNDIESYIKNMKQSISFEEILGTSNFLLIDKYTSLATEYSKIEDIANSKKYILQAERLLKRLDDLEIKMWSTKTIFDYYFSYGLENKEILFRKSLRLLNDAFKEAEDAENYEYQYWCLLRLASLYHAIGNNPGLQYDYFVRADSLLLEHNLAMDIDYMGWRFFDVMGDNNELDRIRRITGNIFEYHTLNGNLRSAFYEGLEYYFTYVYNQTLEEKDYITFKEMIKRYDDIEKGEFWSLQFKLKEWQIELAQHQTLETYHKSMVLIPQLISMKDAVIDQEHDRLLINYIWIGKVILKHTYLNGDSDQFQKLLSFIEPLQWNYGGGIESDNWFLDFTVGKYGPFNDTLYTKYIDRILSYPLSAERLFEKRIHGNVLLNVYGNITESIRIYEEALLEAKQLGLLEEELIILVEMAKRYGSNRQFSLSKRRYFEARDIAKALGNDDELETILANMLDQIINVSDPEYYELSLEYLTISRKLNSYIGEIQAIGLLLQYFQHIQEPDSAVQYMLEGFSIKDSVITNVSTLMHLRFVSICFNYINNDMTGKVSDPIKGWVFDDKKIEDPKLQRIYEEMIYLKDFDFSTLDQENINQYPFIYNNVLDYSITLREFWDKDYLRANEFKNKLEFLLSLDVEYNEWGLINAFWAINGRIKDVEDVSGGRADKYFGFGFKYDISPEYHGLKPTLIFDKSPSNGKFYNEDVILIDSDEELSSEYAKEFMVSKINEADVLLNKPTTFTVLRDGIDTVLIDIIPGDVQPNFYSEYPVKEIQYLINKFFETSDSLLQTAENIHSYPGFTNTYREFLIAYPLRYFYSSGLEMDSEQYMELLDRYEAISTYNLVNESIKHKTNMQNNPVLIDEYRKYSARINQIQLELQKPGLNENELSDLQKARNLAYGELAYFENYNLERSSSGTSINKFSFSDNLDLFNEFDVIIRYCNTDYLKNGSFQWIKSQDRMKFWGYKEFCVNGQKCLI